MVNIYVFGHFGKPFLETVGAVAGGLVLGMLAIQASNICWACSAIGPLQ